jgi:zinc protease
VERLRTERLAALQQQQSQPMTTAFKVMWREHYGADHPYGYLGLGTPASNEAITRDDLLRSYRRDFTPRNAALILTGDLSESEARRLAEDTFGGWKGSRPPAAEVSEGAPSGERVFLVDRPGSPQTALVLAQPGPTRGDPDFDKLLVVNGVLGDLFSSRLNQSLRERHGFTYGVDSEVTQSPVPGLIYAALSVDRQQTGASVVETLAEVARLKQSGLTRVELDEARQAIVRSLPAMFRTNGSTTGSIAHLYVHDLPQRYFRELEDRLGTLTVDQVNAVAGKWLEPDLMKIVAVGDRTSIEEQLRSVGLGPPAVRTSEALPG